MSDTTILILQVFFSGLLVVCFLAMAFGAGYGVLGALLVIGLAFALVGGMWWLFGKIIG
ncbi:hypothetical protein LG293_17405 (plasmid) [Citricoccus nitrophenolicus]